MLLQVYNALNHNEIEPCACLATAELMAQEIVQFNRTLTIHAGDLVRLRFGACSTYAAAWSWCA